MSEDVPSSGLTDRVRQILAVYEKPGASVAQLLCDNHDPASIAYRVVASDLSACELTYDELATSSRRLANSLAAMGLGQGDRIVTLMGKSVDYLVTLLAIWRIGAVQVPLFTAFAPPAIAYRLAASECKLIVCDPSQRCKLEFGAIAPVNASWRILCTTGAQSGDLSLPDLISTGRPDPDRQGVV